MNTTTCTCRRCGRNLNPSTAIEEHQESLVINFRAGYGSVFGDGNIVSSTLCQHCLKTLLGDFLEVIEDDPIHPQIAVPAPVGACQPNQLQAPAKGRPSQAELRSLFPQLQEPSAE
jgi:hypothetical protein